MENGLFQSSAYGMLNPGVNISSLHLKWLHGRREGSNAAIRHEM